MPEEHLDFAAPADLGRLGNLGSILAANFALVTEEEGRKDAETLESNEAKVGAEGRQADGC